MSRGYLNMLCLNDFIGKQCVIENAYLSLGCKSAALLFTWRRGGWVKPKYLVYWLWWPMTRISALRRK